MQIWIQEHDDVQKSPFFAGFLFYENFQIPLSLLEEVWKL